MVFYDKITLVFFMEKKNNLHDLVKKIIDAGFTDAIYLEEFNKKEELHLHLVITEDKMKLFVKLYNMIIDSISNSIYIKKSSSQTYIRFDDDMALFIHFEFDNFYTYCEYNTLYDPNGKLINAVISPTPEDVGNVINEITYNLDRFFNFFRTDDKVNAIKYLSIVNENVLLYFKYMFNPDKEYRNYKTLISELPRDLKPKYNKMLSKLKIDSLIECAKMIFVLLDDFISNISINVAFVVDIDYYLFIKKAIFTF